MYPFLSPDSSDTFCDLHTTHGACRRFGDKVGQAHLLQRGACWYERTIREAKNSLLDGIEIVKERYGEMDDQKMMPHSIRGDYRVEFDIQPSLRDYPDDLEIKK